MKAVPAPHQAARKRRARRRRQRGIAFVLVLGALTILTVMMAEVQDESSAEFSSALSARDALVAEYAARSAVNLSRLLIATEPTIRKSMGPLLAMLFRGQVPQIPVWEFSDGVLGAFNDAAGAEAFSGLSGLDLSRGKNLGLPGASFEVKVVDEDSKLNVNIAARGNPTLQRHLMQQMFALMMGPQYDPLFENKDRDGNFSDRQAICSAIIDWVDPDQDTMLCDPTVETAQDSAAEDSYYQLLNKPYQRKNAPLDSLEELRKVRGMGEDFWATFIDPDPERPDKRVLTVWGAGGINVNTASPQALLAFVCSIAVKDTKLCVDTNEMQKFLTVVTLAKGFTMGAPAFSTPKAFLSALRGKGLLGPLLAAAGLEPIQVQAAGDAEKQITTESKVFSIYAVGVVKSGKRETRVRIHSVIDFRGAPPPREATDPSTETGTEGDARANTETPPGTGTQNDPQTATGEALKRAMEPSPAGNVVYFKLD